MAYEKQEWKDLPDKSTPITATRLNHIENGIEENDIKINEIDTNMNKTIVSLFDKTITTGETYKYNDNANYLDYRFLFIVLSPTNEVTIVPVSYISSGNSNVSLKGIDDNSNVLHIKLKFLENGFSCEKCGYSLVGTKTVYDNPYQIKIIGIK